MAIRRVLGDSNVLVHLTNPLSYDYTTARKAVAALDAEGVMLFYTAQNLAEFWNVCTRVGPGGLGLSIEDTAKRVKIVEDRFSYLAETNSSEAWLKDLLVRYRVRGVQVHDARLTAMMLANGIREILTFDRGDFDRFAEVSVIHPEDAASAG